MRSRLLPALFAAAVLLGAAPAAAYPPVPQPKPKKPAEQGKDLLKQLEGTWTVLSYEYGPAKGVARTSLYQKIEIKDGKWVQVRDSARLKKAGGAAGVITTSRTAPYTLVVDASKSPPTLDMKLATSKLSTATRLGVLRLDGNKLTVTYLLRGQERPKCVDGELALRQYRWVLQREAPDPK